MARQTQCPQSQRLGYSLLRQQSPITRGGAVRAAVQLALVGVAGGLALAGPGGRLRDVSPFGRQSDEQASAAQLDKGATDSARSNAVLLSEIKLAGQAGACTELTAPDLPLYGVRELYVDVLRAPGVNLIHATNVRSAQSCSIPGN